LGVKETQEYYKLVLIILCMTIHRRGVDAVLVILLTDRRTNRICKATITNEYKHNY